MSEITTARKGTPEEVFKALSIEEEKVLPKGITQQAKVWTYHLAKNIKVKAATNPDSIFLIGRTLLDKNTFNKLNDTEHDYVHGIQCMWGPFSNKQSAREFISEYDKEWPSDSDWIYVHPGVPEVISSYYELKDAEVVENKALEFQGQAVYAAQQEKIKEIESVQKRLKERQEKAIAGEVTFTQPELEKQIQWEETKLKQMEQQLSQVKAHLEKLIKLRK